MTGLSLSIGLGLHSRRAAGVSPPAISKTVDRTTTTADNTTLTADRS